MLFQPQETILKREGEGREREGGKGERERGKGERVRETERVCAFLPIIIKWRDS